MINVDISNVWTCVSLSDLLTMEKEVFDAHLRLRDGSAEDEAFMGWLRMSAMVSGRLVQGIGQSARAICDRSQVLLICGCGGAYHGAKAAIEAYCGAYHNVLRKPQILWIGNTLSARQWQDMSRLLQDKDYSLLILSPDGCDPSVNVTTRGLRWMMERKYGAQAKSRICVGTMVGTPLHTMAQEEGYELFPLPKQPGGFSSCVTSAALLAMAVAGIDPLAVLEGAAEGSRDMDVRSFENPAWLYAAARTMVSRKGRNAELLCVTEPALQPLGDWWQRTLWRQGAAITAQTVLLPGDQEAADRAAMAADSRVFETVLHFAPEGKKIPVEMDWKDYDGLGFLSGKHTDYVQQHMMQAMIETHNGAGVPVIDVDAGELTADTLGTLLCFFELSAALSALLEGKDPFDRTPPAARMAALEAMA